MPQTLSSVTIEDGTVQMQLDIGPDGDAVRDFALFEMQINAHSIDAAPSPHLYVGTVSPNLARECCMRFDAIHRVPTNQ